MTENKAKKMPILSLYAEYPNIPAWQNTFPSRVLYTRGRRRKATDLWKGGEGSKRKEEEKEEGSCLNHRCLPLLTSHKLEGCVLGIPRGKTKNKTTTKKTPLYFFRLPSSSLLCSTEPVLPRGKQLPWVPRRADAQPWPSEAGTQEDSTGRTRTGTRRAPRHLLWGPPSNLLQGKVCPSRCYKKFPKQTAEVQGPLNTKRVWS